MLMALVRILKASRVLELGTLEAMRVARKVVAFWDKRVLELLEMEIGSYSIHCHFKCCEDNFT